MCSNHQGRSKGSAVLCPVQSHVPCPEAKNSRARKRTLTTRSRSLSLSGPLSLSTPLSRRGRPELTRLYDLGFGAAVAPGLTEHAHRVWTDENAGGSSRNSEAMSMELLR